MALSKARVSLVGSSFLKHLNENIQNSAYPDLLVDFGLDQIATQFVCGVGWLLKDVDYHKDIIKSFHPDVIILQIGGNDLCRFNVRPESVADQLLELASLLRTETGASYVILGHIIRRVLGRYISSSEEQSDLELARIKANKFLEVVSNEFQDIKFWKHRGFEESQYDILAHDGVHFSALGQSRFHKSLRGAILTTLKHLNYQP